MRSALLVVFLASCTLNATTVGPGSASVGPAKEDGGPVVPRVFLTSACSVKSGPWLDIGSSMRSIIDGETEAGAIVGVRCRVTPNGGGFLVEATASVAGTGAFQVAGLFTPDGAGKVLGSFQRADTGKFDQPDCTVTYPGGVESGAAPGRVYANLTCPSAKSAQDGRSCAGTATLRFEDCTQ